jgi:hypothetical protein
MRRANGRSDAAVRVVRTNLGEVELLLTRGNVRSCR